MEHYDQIEPFLIELDSSTDTLISYGKLNVEVNSNMYMFDIYITGLLNRSVNIIRGFSSLMRDHNFIAAAPLVRVHLDSLLRLFAPQLINYNVDEFAMQVFQGTPIRKIKDNENKFLTDSHLVMKISDIDGFEWVKKVYDTGNSFIHFTDQTIIAAVRASNKRNFVNLTIGKHDSFIPFSEKHGAVHWMVKITQSILALIYNWTEQKKGYTQICG